MATYHLAADVVLDWTPRKLTALQAANNKRERSNKMWQIAVARIPGLAEPSEYIDELMSGLMTWDEYTASQAPGMRLDEMSEEQLKKLGVKIVDTGPDGESVEAPE